MNISPHQQRPTKYPWPGNQPVLGVAVVITLVLIIGFIVVNWMDDNDESEAEGARVTAPLSIGDGAPWIGRGKPLHNRGEA